LILLNACVTSVNKFREYGISYLDGGSSCQLICFCPWCGHKLPDSLRDEWFDMLDEKGLEPDSENIPKEFLTEAWYS
jgi:hypothetical protein